MKTIALTDNNHIAATMELSTFESLKSFHFGRRLACVRGGVAKLLVFYFRLSCYQFIYSRHKTLGHMFTCAYIYQENMPISYLLSSIQPIEWVICPYSLQLWVGLSHVSVITRAVPNCGKGTMQKAKNESHTITESDSRIATTNPALFALRGLHWACRVLYANSWSKRWPRAGAAPTPVPSPSGKGVHTCHCLRLSHEPSPCAPSQHLPAG